jgi:hypothetical protein
MNPFLDDYPSVEPEETFLALYRQYRHAQAQWLDLHEKERGSPQAAGAQNLASDLRRRLLVDQAAYQAAQHPTSWTRLLVSVDEEAEDDTDWYSVLDRQLNLMNWN